MSGVCEVCDGCGSMEIGMGVIGIGSYLFSLMWCDRLAGVGVVLSGGRCG